MVLDLASGFMPAVKVWFIPVVIDILLDFGEISILASSMEVVLSSSGFSFLDGFLSPEVKLFRSPG